MLDLLKKTIIVNISLILLCDAPDFWQLRLQDPISFIMERILLFNEHFLFIASMIAILKGRLLFSLILSSGNVSWEFVLSSKLSKQTKKIFSLFIVKTIIILMFNSFLFLSVEGFLKSSLFVLGLSGGFGFLIAVVIFYKPKLKRLTKKLVFLVYQLHALLLLRSFSIIETVSTVIFSYFAVNLFLNLVGMFLNGNFSTPDSIIMDLCLQLSQRETIGHEGFSDIEKFCMFADNQDSTDAGSNTADVPSDLSDSRSVGSVNSTLSRFNWDSGLNNLTVDNNSSQNNDSNIFNSTDSVQDINARTVSQDTEDSSVAPSSKKLLAQERRKEIAKIESEVIEFFKYWRGPSVQEFESNYGRSDSELFKKLRTEMIEADKRNQYEDGFLVFSKKDIGEELSEALTNHNENLELANFGTSVLHEKLEIIEALAKDFESEFDEPYKSPNNFDAHKHEITKKIRYFNKGLKIKLTDATFPRPRTGS